jgi:putative ABC transport system substrate-binding protein
MKTLQRNFVFLLLAAVLLTVGPFVHAQHPTKTPRIGYLATVPLAAMADRVEGLVQGLRELGYVEGKNIVIEWRSAEGELDHLSALAAELPVEQPIKSDFDINLKAAKTIGVGISPVLLQRADQVIE